MPDIGLHAGDTVTNKPNKNPGPCGAHTFRHFFKGKAITSILLPYIKCYRILHKPVHEFDSLFQFLNKAEDHFEEVQMYTNVK